MDAIESIRELIQKADKEMHGRIDKLMGELGALRTGRANPQLVDSIKVEYYGQPVPLKQVAAVSVPEGRTLEIRPWDPAVLPDIEKALQKSDLGIPPQSDGKAIRLNLPSMTEERRKDMIKIVRRMAEEYRVGLRNDRRDILEKLKKAQKAKELSEDDLKRHESDIQKLTDAHIKKVDELLAGKEREITTV